jgi:hypothetical protein
MTGARLNLCARTLDTQLEGMTLAIDHMRGSIGELVVPVEIPNRAAKA